MNLNELGDHFGCDKSDQYHTFKGKTYLDVYEKYFSPFRDLQIVFLELGVRDGKSIQIWKNYFKNAKIIGIDIDPSCSRFAGANVAIETGSQADKDFINDVIEKYGPFDIILDDASHINDLTLISFDLLRPHVKNGGMYIIEDLRNSYEDLTEDVKSWPGMHLNQNVNFNNSVTRKDLDSALFQIVKDLDYRRSDFTSVNFHSQLVVLKK